MAHRPTLQKALHLTSRSLIHPTLTLTTTRRSRRNNALLPENIIHAAAIVTIRPDRPRPSPPPVCKPGRSFSSATSSAISVTSSAASSARRGMGMLVVEERCVVDCSVQGRGGQEGCYGLRRERGFGDECEDENEHEQQQEGEGEEEHRRSAWNEVLRRFGWRNG